jgi:hypothetical protein
MTNTAKSVQDGSWIKHKPAFIGKFFRFQDYLIMKNNVICNKQKLLNVEMKRNL